MRPSASVSEEPKPGQAAPSEIDWAHYVKWGILAALVLTAVGLVSSVYVTYSEKSRSERLRAEWDEYHNAIFEKKSDDDRIEALEKLADNPKVKGTTVHAYILASLAHANFEMSQSPRRKIEARADALDRAIGLNRLLATTEPFMSNPSFGPPALQNVAIGLEQKQVNDPKSTQYYDEAIKTLQGALYKDDSKDADPRKEMKASFLFDKMNAQLGRLYWLRGLRKIELDPAHATTAADSDNAMALTFLKKALEAGISSVEKDRFGTDFKGSWREEAAYIKSLLDPKGRMMASGVAPAMKIPSKAKVSIDAAPKGATATASTATITTTTPHKFEAGDMVTVEGVVLAGYNGTFSILTTPTPNSFSYVVSAKDLAASGGGSAEVKGNEAKKDDVKKPDEPKKADEPKKEEPKKDEPKKTGALKRSSSSDALASESSQHMSYAQIQALLKAGRPALCQCPRCVDPDKAIGAKLTE